ncbi:MAG TPA: aminotransferase class I/II-fold pyridoxal phosphate-dependent enzyme [Acidimicrobiia bacterium]|nr:aminotransferase class I/II-fold pyridoxal phosphate-dependent enzyme [Acidimicrobiia bacterium]
MRTNPILTQLGAYPIATLQERARAMRAAGEPLVDFSIGDPREPTPAFIPEELRRSVPVVSEYPTTSGLPELRRSVAGYVRRRFGVEVDPDTQVLPTAGSKEAIFSTPLAFVDRAAGSVVVWATPGYPIYERGALLAGGEGFPVTLDGDFVLRPAQIPDPVWDRTALVWINYPHNPTGAVIERSGFEDLYRRARRAGAWLCSDECYVDIYEGEPPPSILQAAGSGSRGALSYLSLSKRSGMTGYRSAVIVGDAEGIAILKDLRTATGTASPEFVQKAAITAWDDDDHVAERRAIFAAKRAILRTAFEDTGHQVVASKAGIYIWARVGDDVAVAERLLAQGIIVSPGRAFGVGGEGFLRLALTPTLEETEQATEVLKACLTET